MSYWNCNVVKLDTLLERTTTIETRSPFPKTESDLSKQQCLLGEAWGEAWEAPWHSIFLESVILIHLRVPAHDVRVCSKGNKKVKLLLREQLQEMSLSMTPSLHTTDNSLCSLRKQGGVDNNLFYLYKGKNYVDGGRLDEQVLTGELLYNNEDCGSKPKLRCQRLLFVITNVNQWQRQVN